MLKVAAAILRQQGRILICRRAPGGSLGGLWEFPGGKLEAGERPEEAMVRECREELQVAVTPERLYESFSYAYPDKEITFWFYLARIAEGTVEPLVHSELCWAGREELEAHPFCPADVPMVRRLMEDAAVWRPK